MSIINNLVSLTEGETAGNYESFINANYYCSTGIIHDLWIYNHDIKEKKIIFYDDNQELLIHTNIDTFSCAYKTYCNIKFITHIFDKKGLVKEYSFNYDSDICNCLYDISELKKKFPDRWVYRLDDIYNKYGVDTVNAVREYAHFNN